MSASAIVPGPALVMTQSDAAIHSGMFFTKPWTCKGKISEFWVCVQIGPLRHVFKEHSMRKKGVLAVHLRPKAIPLKDQVSAKRSSNSERYEGVFFEKHCTSVQHRKSSLRLESANV